MWSLATSLSSPHLTPPFYAYLHSRIFLLFILPTLRLPSASESHFAKISETLPRASSVHLFFLMNTSSRTGKSWRIEHGCITQCEKVVATESDSELWVPSSVRPTSHLITFTPYTKISIRPFSHVYKAAMTSSDINSRLLCTMKAPCTRKI